MGSDACRGELVRFKLAGKWYAGTVAMFDDDNPSLCVEFPRPFLPWPLGRFCYVGRGGGQLLRRPLRVGEFAATFRGEFGVPIFDPYEWGLYASCWCEPVTPEYIAGMARSLGRDYARSGPSTLLQRLFTLATVAGIEVPPQL